MIKIVCVGRIKDRNLKNLIDDYVLKISHYHRLEMIEVKDESIGSDEKAVLSVEADRLLEKIRDDEYVILLDLHGRSIDSLSLADKLDKLFIRNPRIVFVIGGSLGLDDRLRKRANESLKLSDLTFLHQMTRLILLEQIYRSFKILNHETYHK
ncbi:MAG: 23S rRNA (pseudouridine(1915)-N(3))-methyltransferase RlmH [Erysipelotrichaceae bacterium]|nr:23S rRNA (pseudouridine(1915)-N(3))-methyltransferase RlmH [Erysipelotrichaceae bacterium]MBQ1534017.1 23S rRNA (pseudouridine(1915)-N(3))-methyltransferase RlmH [Erysipelotrichaceae bacterium]